MKYLEILKIQFLLCAFILIAEIVIANPKDSVRIKIQAINLSEDLSVISSKNDEILILLYAYEDSIILGEPILFQFLTFDESNKSCVISISSLKWNLVKQKLMFMIELDSDKTIQQIDPTIRVYHKEIKQLYLSEDWTNLKDYFGDDDPLGMKIFDDKYFIENANIVFSRFVNIDKYEYNISIEGN